MAPIPGQSRMSRRLQDTLLRYGQVRWECGGWRNWDGWSGHDGKVSRKKVVVDAMIFDDEGLKVKG